MKRLVWYPLEDTHEYKWHGFITVEEMELFHALCPDAIYHNTFTSAGGLNFGTYAPKIIERMQRLADREKYFKDLMVKENGFYIHIKHKAEGANNLHAYLLTRPHEARDKAWYASHGIKK